jgi:hypothetical protein
MKKRTNFKLTLNRETLRHLSEARLTGVAGGRPTSLDTRCSDCGTCGLPCSDGCNHSTPWSCTC